MLPSATGVRLVWALFLVHYALIVTTVVAYGQLWAEMSKSVTGIAAFIALPGAIIGAVAHARRSTGYLAVVGVSVLCYLVVFLLAVKDLTITPRIGMIGYRGLGLIFHHSTYLVCVGIVAGLFWDWLHSEPPVR